MITLKPLSEICDKISNLKFETATGCRYNTILANKLCDTPIQIGNVYIRVNKSNYTKTFYASPYMAHYWCVDDSADNTTIYDSLDDLKKFVMDYFMNDSNQQFLLGNVTFLNKEYNNIKITEISGLNWQNKTRKEFVDYISKTFKDSDIDLIYVTELTYDYFKKDRFLSQANLDKEFDACYEVISNWLDSKDLSKQLYISDSDMPQIEIEYHK